MQFTSPKNERSLRTSSARRQGKTLSFTLAAIAIAACLSLVGWFLFGPKRGLDTQELLTSAAWKGPYDYAILEPGVIESGLNTELKCEVRSRGGSTTILDVVPEGTVVKAGDTVVELDSSNLLQEESNQKILVSTRESQVAQAENTLHAAEIAKQEYSEGLYVSQEGLLLSELYLAERARATAEASLESSKILYTKTIVTALQVHAAQASLDDAANTLDRVQTQLTTLRELTKPKELTLLEAAISSADANVKAQRQGLNLELERLKDIQAQIAKCTIKAPSVGQVVYANESDPYRSGMSSQFIVAPGSTVRERQVIIWLPNADDMQVKATVNEAHITLVRPGMPVSIRVEALEDEMLEGQVIRINQYAEPSYSSSQNIRKYATIIKIKNAPRELRVGMNAEVRIHVERMPEALQVPVQALAETKGHYFSLVKNGDEYETREVEIGSANDKVATITRGLQEGDEVVMNPRSTGDLLKLPNLPDETPIVMDEIKRSGRVESGGDSQIADKPVADNDSKIEPTEMTPAEMVARYLENDANMDDRLSKEEIATMGARLQQRLVTGDANGDGFLERRELLMVAATAARQSREKGKSGGETSSGTSNRRARGDRATPGDANAGG